MKILVLTAIRSGLDGLRAAILGGLEVSRIVAFVAESPSVAGGVSQLDIENFAREFSIQYSIVDDYSLQSIPEGHPLLSEDYDLLWVAGWQRLIPESVLRKPRLGGIGGHGSHEGITRGRGRSPQNWAIILGSTRFELSLFSLHPGVDDGPVLLTRRFPLHAEDDINTSYKKTSLMMAEMVMELVNNPSLIDQARPQSGRCEYLPQRKPEDGLVDWSMEAEEIARYSRALRAPYPGLYAHTEDGAKIVFERVIPFLDFPKPTGLIDFVFRDGDFVVGCKGGTVLVREYYSENGWVPQVGDELHGGNRSRINRAIVQRHQLKRPTQMLSASLLEYLAQE